MVGVVGHPAARRQSGRKYARPHATRGKVVGDELRHVGEQITESVGGAQLQLRRAEGVAVAAWGAAARELTAVRGRLQRKCADERTHEIAAGKRLKHGRVAVGRDGCRRRDGGRNSMRV